MPFLVKVFSKLDVKLSVMPHDSLQFFVDVIRQIIAQRKTDGFVSKELLNG